MNLTAKLAVLAILAWGAFAFGAVYEWAYVPLLTACGTLGVVGFFRFPRVQPISGLVGPTAVLLLVAVALQLVPLPISILERLSPETLVVVRQYDLGFGAGLSSVHAASIFPPATRLALIFLVCLIIFAAGLRRLVSAVGARWLVQAIFGLAVILAIVGIVQKPLYNGMIYGFWTPINPGNPFGPFVNRNHFAGWMLMAIPPSVGFLCSSVSNAMHGVKPTRHDRTLWLGTPEASKILLMAAGVMLTGLSLVLSLSRSGLLIFVMSMGFMAAVAALSARTGAGAKRLAAMLFLAGVVVAVVAWVGADAIATRFDEGGVDLRLGAWQDAWSVARRFPILGIGLNTYGSAMLFYQQHNLMLHFDAAHNDYLQLVAEGGVLVGIPALLCVLALIAGIRRQFREHDIHPETWWIRVGAVTGLAAIALQEIGDFSLQIPGNAVLFAALCAIALHRPAAPAYTPGQGSRRSHVNR